MDEAAVRVVVVLAAMAAVVGVAVATRRWQRSAHNPVDVTGAGLPAGIVIFTATDCANCLTALQLVKTTGAPVREVTWELEPTLIGKLGVTSVPLTLVLDADGVVARQFVGVPNKRKLVRALHRADIHPTRG